MHNHFKICLLMFAALSLGTTACLAAAQDTKAAIPAVERDSPSKRYLKAYDAMSTADWLSKREMNEDAAMLYTESLKLFQQLASDYPMWQTNLVVFRINYCREGLDRARGVKNADDSETRPGNLPQADSGNHPSPPLPVKERRDAALPPQEPGPAAVKETAPQQRKSFDGENRKESTDKIQKAAELEKEGDLNGALDLYRLVLERNNQEAKALGGAGRCLLKLGKLDEARALLFQWSIIPSPDNDVNLLLALILCADKQFARALQLAEIVVNEDKTNAAAHVIMGTALAGTGQTDAAVVEMQKALAANPRLAEAHYNLAKLLLKKGPKYKSTAVAYYINALKFGAMPDPELAKRLQR